MLSCTPYLRGFIAKGSALSPFNRYLLVRDITFFVFDFYTGNRASDLGRLKADQLFHLKDREGFLLNFTFSKTRHAGQSSPFTLLCIPNVPVCPVFLLNFYIAACGALGVPLHVGYLFRSSEHKKFKSHRLFAGPAVSAQLQIKVSLGCWHLWQGDPSQLLCRNFIHPQGFGMNSGVNCPVHGLFEHSDGFILHVPL